jgi:hypothetical protein
VHLLNELGSELFHWDINQILELFLVGERTDHRYTVAVMEEALEQSPDPVLLFNAV